MTDLSKLVIRISSGLGKRKTKAQKNKFLSYFGDTLSVLGYQGETSSGRQKRNPTINLIMGDVTKTKLIISTDYNTRNISVIPNYKYYPLNDTKNAKNEQKEFVIRVILSALIVLLLVLLNLNLQIMKDNLVVRIIVNIILLILFLLTMFGISAPYNMNCNSASLATLFMIADDMKQEKKKPAFVFADGMSLTTIGYKYVSEYLKEKKVNPDIPFVIMTCVADGEELFIARRSDASKEAITLVEKFKEKNFNEIIIEPESSKNTVLESFRNGIVLLSGSKEENDIVVKNTRSFKDSNADIDRLNLIAKLLENYVKEK